MLDKKENNDNYNYILNKRKEYLSVHMGRVETSISSKERNAIITLKIPFLIITDELINSLNEAKNRVQNIMIFPYGEKELAVRMLVDYSRSGESELQKAANHIFDKYKNV